MADGIRVKITGVRELKKNLDRARQAVREAFEQGMDDYADELLQKSRDLAPQLTGAMIRNSGTDKQDTRDTLRRSVFYEDNYALFQHEGNFNPGPITAAKTGAGRKFLQRPYDASKQEFLRKPASRGNRALKLVTR